VATINVIGKGR